MYRNSIIFLVLTLVLLVTFEGCREASSNKKQYPENGTVLPSANQCTEKIWLFAKGLKLDTSEYINAYFSDDKFQLKNCLFKNFRKEENFHAAIALIILKLYKYQLQRGDGEKVLLYPFRDISKFASNIVNEYAIMYYGKITYYDETFFVSSIIDFMKRYPKLFKFKYLQYEYDECISLLQNFRKNHEEK